MAKRGVETLLLKGLSERDWQGDRVNEGADVEVPNCIVWPRTSAEDESVVTSGRMAFVPDISAPITAESVVEHRGDTYRVVGEPGPYRKKRGTPVGLIVTLERVRTNG